MNIRDLIPESFRDYVFLVKNKKRFPESIIGTPHIGADVTVGKMAEITRDCRVGNNSSIGDYSYINQGTIITSGTIGKFCSVGPNCQIGLENHPIYLPSSSPFTYGKRNLMNSNVQFEEIASPPIIENDVWIGGNATILQGVKIGTGAVVAAGAVVTKDVEPYSIVGGVPAKIIKYRFDPDTIKSLIESEWWDKSSEDIKEIFIKINN